LGGHHLVVIIFFEGKLIAVRLQHLLCVAQLKG